jgi:subtilisin-like proprotein convertase family protein
MRLLLLILGLFLFSNPGFAQISETPFATAEVSVNLPIPDDHTPIRSSITINGSELLKDLRVAVKIQHEDTSQLRITLTHPTGQTIVLHNQSSSTMNPFNPVYETLIPSETTLSLFYNITAQGTWTLTVEDLVAGKIGTLISWGMMVSPQTLLDPLPPTPLPIMSGSEFSTVTSEVLSATANAIYCGDVNADNLDDLFVLSTGGNAVFVYTSKGSSLNPPQTISVTAPKQMELSDLNRDNLMDIITASSSEFGQTTTVSVFIATPEGGYATGFKAELPTTINQLSVFDADNDQRPDIIAGGAPVWLKGNGDGSFQAQDTFVFLGKELVSTADINQDGFEDLLVRISRGGTSLNSDPYAILLDQNSLFPLIQSDGTKLVLNGTLKQAITASTREAGKDDILILSQSTDAEPVQLFTTIQADLNGIVSTIESRLAQNTISFPVYPFDINGDGLDEIIFPNSQGVVSFQKYTSASGGDTKTLVSNPDITQVCAGLFFADGSVGLAAITKSNELLLLQSNLGERPVPPQFITPTPTPTSAIFITPTPTPSQPPVVNTPTPVPPLIGNPDLNGDGVVDKFDLLLLVESWGPVNQ